LVFWVSVDALAKRQMVVRSPLRHLDRLRSDLR
jgi:hypothetical protein